MNRDIVILAGKEYARAAYFLASAVDEIRPDIPRGPGIDSFLNHAGSEFSV